ncbi:hypothetical protein MRB53_010376 [Persea americana]|uniref:Uncharacterized protein n=1 Tax=Persea americana TaxID=3435 RepID=A0ACC2LRS4_PERAE|nr:hypothetical protein MRB53_010376 [Persea americana]
MEERVESKRRRRTERSGEGEAAPQASTTERGNISFMDEKEITFVKKMALAIDISHEKTSGALKSVRWSDLPMDILMLVTQHLNLADHVRISITCKSWQRTAPSFLSSKSPALLFIENQRQSNSSFSIGSVCPVQESACGEMDQDKGIQWRI